MSDIAIELLVELSELENGPDKARRLNEEVLPYIESLWAYHADDEGYQVVEVVPDADDIMVTEQGLVVTVECFGEERRLKVLDAGWGAHFAEVTIGVYGATIYEAHAKKVAAEEHEDQKRMWGDSDEDED